MGSFEPTPEQRRAMEDRGGSLLVSAAAGPARPRCWWSGCSAIWSGSAAASTTSLIITFTKAAAAAQGRIAAELSQRVARQPENMHLRRQMMRVYQADIKTVDAFSGACCGENIHLLPPEGQRSLTPDFRVLDQQEAELLRMQVLEQVLRSFYQRIGRGIPRPNSWRRRWAPGGTTGRWSGWCWTSTEDPEPRLPHAVAGAAAGAVAAGAGVRGSYREVLTDSILRRTRFWARKLTETAAWMEQYPDLYRGYGDRFLEMAEQLQGYETAAQEGWDAMARLKPAFRRMGVVKGCDGAKGAGAGGTQAVQGRAG